MYIVGKSHAVLIAQLLAVTPLHFSGHIPANVPHASEREFDPSIIGIANE